MVKYQFRIICNNNLESTSQKMEQAFGYFNSGKHKEAFNHLNSNALNIQSYEPNLAICEYLLSRTSNSSQVCLRKLTNLLIKKIKKDSDHYEKLTQQLIKYNIGILMHLNGKKENAYLLFKDIYNNEKCFIDFLKYRLLLLLMELNLNMKNGVEALKLSSKYLSNSYQQRNPSPSWISLLFHEHFKSYFILKEELDFMFGIFVSQSLMQLGVSEIYLPPDQQREALRDNLLEKAKKRKNNPNKYYELSLLMIDRFFQAQKQFHLNNKQIAMQLMNFASIQSDYQQIPQTKIITNIYSALTNNNSAIIYYSIGKSNLALHFFNKANILLSKGCTGVQDKDLQLFSSNFSNHSHKIGYNIGLIVLQSKPTEAHQIFEFFRKNNYMCSDYKYWYRMGQAELEYYHQNYQKLTPEFKELILQSALTSFTNSLSTLMKKQLPFQNLGKMFPILKEEQIDLISLKIKGETQSFRQSILILICYISLLAERYYKVIFHAKQLLKAEKTPDSTRIYVTQYLMESYVRLNRMKEANKAWNQLEKLTKNNKKIHMKTGYFTKSEIFAEKMDIQNLILHQSVTLKIKQNALKDAKNLLEKQKNIKTGKTSQSRRILSKYLAKKLQKQPF